jgi:RNA binding exosome subunit
MAELLGTDEFECEIADGEHGNRMVIFSIELSKQREVVPVFQKLGRDIIEEVSANLEERIDEDCVLYLRFDKQELVQGRYVIAHHGDVLSLTGKIASHPARKEIAVRNMREFLSSLDLSEN